MASIYSLEDEINLSIYGQSNNNILDASLLCMDDIIYNGRESLSPQSNKMGNKVKCTTRLSF